LLLPFQKHLSSTLPWGGCDTQEGHMCAMRYQVRWVWLLLEADYVSTSFLITMYNIMKDVPYEVQVQWMAFISFKSSDYKFYLQCTREFSAGRQDLCVYYLQTGWHQVQKLDFLGLHALQCIWDILHMTWVGCHGSSLALQSKGTHCQQVSLLFEPASKRTALIQSWISLQANLNASNEGTINVALQGRTKILGRLMTRDKNAGPTNKLSAGQQLVKVKVTRPTVSRPVHPGVRRPSGTRDQFFCLLESIF
jgi:hypothetical protein